MKLQVRLALTVALAAAVAILGMATAAWVLGSNQQRQDVDTALLRVVSAPRRFIDVNGGGAGPTGGDRAIRGVRNELAIGLDGIDARVFARVRLVANGNVVYDDGLPSVDPTTIGEGGDLSTIEIDGERFRMATVELPGQRSGVLQVARNIEDLEDGLARLRRQIVGASLIGILFAGLLGALVARRLAAPIAEVANAAKELALNNDLPQRIEVGRSDEVGDLATSFNQMLAALQLSRDQQRRLVGDASHELRTPLTSLRLKIDLLNSKSELPDDARRELISTSASELERLGELVNELVDLATDPTGVEEAPIDYALTSLVQEVATEVERRSGRTITVTATASDSFPIRVRMARRAVSNLLGNAVKYSESGEISVAVDGPRVEVRDRGDGIPESDLEYVFDRFYRAPSTRDQPGNGIGLAIVRRVADLHGGRAWARNASDGPGAVVGFSIASES